MKGCKGRESGCEGAAKKGYSRCETCRLIHNARMATLRAERKEMRCCTVCAGPAVVVNGVALTVCAMHQDYYRVRALSWRASQ